MKILIVEDNLINQKVLAGLLEKLNYTYEIANNGKEAVDCCMRMEFIAILMGVDMPIMNGLEATQAIRAREKRLGLMPTLIIGLIADIAQECRKEALTVGMDAYLTQPYDPFLIDKTIKQFYKTFFLGSPRLFSQPVFSNETKAHEEKRVETDDKPSLRKQKKGVPRSASFGDSLKRFSVFAVELNEVVANDKERTERLTQGLEEYKKEIDQQPYNVSLQINYATQLALLARYEEALKIYQYVLQKHPCHVSALYGCAQMLFALGVPVEAFSYCERLLKIKPYSEHVLRLSTRIGAELEKLKLEKNLCFRCSIM